MSFELPVLPFPKDAGQTPYIAVPDDSGKHTVPSSLYLKKKVGEQYLWLPADNDNPVPVKQTLSEAQIGTDQEIIWASGASANTAVVKTFVKPENPVSEYELVVYNPSTVTDLTVQVFSTETGLGDALLLTTIINKAQNIAGTTVNTHIRILHGAFNGGSLKIVCSNNIVLASGQGFTGKLRLRELV